ncbi:MAG: hypothetical protein K2R98_10325 [Gemmataceae bacterium]|nr:hypothetical protein [Gemmataceae bacterium]
MSLHDDLLEQAARLATSDSRRPKQVNLRRSVSSAYYALFHLLIGEASRLYAKDIEMMGRVSRTFNHVEMKRVSTSFVSQRLPKALLPAGGTYAISFELQRVASSFLELQQARHLADYDVRRVFSRQEVLRCVDLSRQAFADWERVKKNDDARLYLACFLLWKRWDEEPR